MDEKLLALDALYSYASRSRVTSDLGEFYL